MRKPIIVGNWKMFTNLEQATQIISTLKEETKDVTDIEIGVCPPYVYLAPVKDLVKNSHINFGAQNMHWEKEGAFTGEISPVMLKNLKCNYVIIGHSERRHVFGETDNMLNKKAKSALEENLTVIFCIGELLEERQEEKTETVLRRQIELGLDSLTEKQMKNIIIAYEPVWAIGTGKTATPQQAQETHSFIRKFISSEFSEQVAQDIRIIYGGSVKPGNIEELSAQPDLDGTLVGGASLKADSFKEIITNYKT